MVLPCTKMRSRIREVIPPKRTFPSDVMSTATACDSILVKLAAFLRSLHWPSEVRDSGPGELLFLDELLAAALDALLGLLAYLLGLVVGMGTLLPPATSLVPTPFAS